MRRSALTLALALLGTATLGPAQAAEPRYEERLYQGSLGNKPVVALLTVELSGSTIDRGSYFYRQFGRDIILGRPDGESAGDARECVDFFSCQEHTGRWAVRLDGEQIKGQWQSPDGKRQLPLQLSQIKPTDGNLAERYSRERLADNKYAPAGNKRQNGVAWKLVKETRSGVVMPQLSEGVPEASRERINAWLEQRLRELVDQALSVTEYTAPGEVLFANPRWFTVGGYSAGYAPGAAHPFGGFSADTFELATGKPVDWQAYFRLAPKNAPQIDLADNTNLSSLAMKAFVQAARKERADEAACFRAVVEAQACSSKHCQALDLLASTVIHPTARGLAVAYQGYPEAARNCRGESVILPWSTLRSAQQDGSPLP